MSALVAMTRVEAKLFLREPVAVLVVLALPVLLLLGFGLIPGFGDPDPFLGGQSGTEFIASIGVGIVLASIGLSGLRRPWGPTGSAGCCAGCRRPRCGRSSCWSPSWWSPVSRRWPRSC